VDSGTRHIVREIPTTKGMGLELGLEKNTRAVDRLEIFPMNSMWARPESSQR